MIELLIGAMFMGFIMVIAIGVFSEEIVAIIRAIKEK